MKKIIVSALTASIIIFAGCKAGGGDPKTVLTSFFEAIMKKDFTTAKKLATKDSEGMMGMVEMGMNNMTDSSQVNQFNKNNIEMGDAVINGDVATVPVKEKTSGESTDFTLKKEGGDWKVAFDKSTLMEMAQKKMKQHGMDMNNMKMPKMDSADMENANKALDSAQKMVSHMKDSMK